MGFPAKYAGQCDECGEQIAVGDLIEWRPHHVTHANGCPDAPELRIERTPCGKCFQVPAANGSCGCDY